ncbi:MAG: hypothetical protein WCB12_05975, partial [Bryobacteraceae bacterium]
MAGRTAREPVWRHYGLEALGKKGDRYVAGGRASDLSPCVRPPNGLSKNYVDVSPLYGGQYQVDSFLTL